MQVIERILVGLAWTYSSGVTFVWCHFLCRDADCGVRLIVCDLWCGRSTQNVWWRPLLSCPTWSWSKRTPKTSGSRSVCVIMIHRSVVKPPITSSFTRLTAINILIRLQRLLRLILQEIVPYPIRYLLRCSVAIYLKPIFCFDNRLN